MRSTYGAAMTVTFMNAWNSYLWPKIVFQSNASITMPMLVANLKSGYSVDYGMLMLGVLICTLPTAIIFLCLQKSFCQRHYGCSQMTARDVCLSCRVGKCAGAVQLAKQLGLIDDASPEALEARRQAKNAENARLQAAGTVFYGPRQYTPAMYLQYELTRFKLDFAQPTAVSERCLSALSSQKSRNRRTIAIILISLPAIGATASPMRTWSRSLKNGCGRRRMMPLCKTYYVNAETGRDNFDGLSEATAFASLRAVNRLTLQPGDRYGWLAAVCLRGNTCT